MTVNARYWIVLIVYLCLAVLIGLLGLLVKPLSFVSKGMLSVFLWLAEALWVVLVWWWLALVLVLARRDPPPLFPFRRKA